MPSRQSSVPTEPQPMPPPPPVQPAPARAARRKRLHWIQAAILLLLALAVAGCAYYFIQYHRLKNDPSAEARAAAQRAVKELSEVMIVPNDPNPVLATVSDKDKLKGQPFFAAAENGDQVIIFPSAMKAVLYRPSAHKVIDIAPLDAGASANSQLRAGDVGPMTDSEPSTPSEPESSSASSSEE